MMRTTVTLDPDVEQILRKSMLETGQSFKATLNQAIRRGLGDTVLVTDEKPFKVQAKDMGLRSGIDPAKLQDLADEIEVRDHLEVTRQLDRRKGTSSSP